MNRANSLYLFLLLLKLLILISTEIKKKSEPAKRMCKVPTVRNRLRHFVNRGKEPIATWSKQSNARDECILPATMSESQKRAKGTWCEGER